MFIDLKTIPLGGRKFNFALEKDWWSSNKQDEQVVAFDSPLEVIIEIYRAGKRYVLNGSLNGGLQVICDRCLEAHHRDLRHDFGLFLIPPKYETQKKEIELLEEDMDVGPIDDAKIDLNGIIREQIYLSLPLKILCSDDCLGLCPVCGSNLNVKRCNCKDPKGHPVFSVLKNLKFEGE